MTREERNEAILILVATRRQSYEVIGRMFEVSRNVVAGVVFRNRYPAAVRQRGKGGKNNQIGTGRRPGTYQPEVSKRNLHKTELRA